MADVYLTEFEKLKDEQISRGAHRDRLFHLTIILIGGGVTIAFSKPDQSMGTLLLLPAVAFVAGMSHIACDRRISSIGSYFKNTLAKRVSERTDIPQDKIFEWETFIRADVYRSGRKRLQFLSNLLLYVGSGLWATAAYAAHVTMGSPHRALNGLEWAACIFDFLLMVLMFWQLTSHSYIRGEVAPADERKRRGSVQRLMMRVVVSALVAALAAFGIIHFGPQFIPEPNLIYTFHWDGTATWQTSRLGIVAASLAAILWSATLLIGRR